MAIKLLVVDDHEVVCRGVESMLRDSVVRVCGTADSVEDAVRQARRHKPQVVLLDVRVGDALGMDAIKRITTAAPGVRVVMFSAFDNPTYVARAAAAGAHDYVLKTATRTELLAAVTGAAEGAAPSRAGEMRRVSATMAKRDPAAAGGVALTPRETQVLRVIALGLSNQEIADALGISVETVKEHVQNLLRKLALGDRTQAAVWALRHGMG